MVFAFSPPGQKVLMIPDLKISPGLQQMIDLNRGQVRALSPPSTRYFVCRDAGLVKWTFCQD